MSPSCGIAAGGTDLTITGEELNIGVQMSVVVAGTLCDVTDKASQREVCFFYLLSVRVVSCYISIILQATAYLLFL